jgi:hypothetical protein
MGRRRISGKAKIMRDTLVVALEASWELDPVLLDERLWNEVEESTERSKSEERTVQDVEV